MDKNSIFSNFSFPLLSLILILLLGNPHPFYEAPYPQEEMGEKEGFGSPILKRNPAPPEDCTACCQDLW